MGEEAQPGEGRAKLYLRLIKRPAVVGVARGRSNEQTPAYVQWAANRARTAAPSIYSTAARRRVQGGLIPASDAAIRNRLKEDIRVVLAVLSPREEQVLRLHFGLGETGCAGEALGTHATRISERMILQALRKLRRPRGVVKRSPVHE